MRLTPRVILAAACLGAAACRSGGGAQSNQPVPDEHPLAGLAAQRIVVTPVYAVRVAPDLGWADRIGKQRDVMRQLDDDIASIFADRGFKSRWVFPEDLVRSYHLNPTYATDPYALGEEPLRAGRFEPGARLPEPLASQIRVMVALHDSRYVLAPVELRLERVAATGTAGRAVLSVALLDARFSEVRMVTSVESDTASAFSPAMLMSAATKVANLVTAP